MQMRDPNNGEWLAQNVCVALLSCLSSRGSAVVKATYESVDGTNVLASLQCSCIFQRKIHKCSRSLKFCAEFVGTVAEVGAQAVPSRVVLYLSIWLSVCFCFHSVVLHVPLSS